MISRLSAEPIRMRYILQINRELQNLLKMNTFFDSSDECKCLDLKSQFEKFRDSNTKSLLKRYLIPDLYDTLKSRGTPTFGANIKDIIQSGLENLDSQIGVYAPDAESYCTFEELFDPIIEVWHNHKLAKGHPKTDFGSPEQLKQFTNLDPMGLYVKKIILSCPRNLVNYPFTPLLSYKMFLEIEEKIKKIVKSIENHELSGSYFSYRTLSKEMEQYLMQKSYFFQDTNKYLRSAKAYQCWPIVCSPTNYLYSSILDGKKAMKNCPGKTGLYIKIFPMISFDPKNGRGVFINNIDDFMICVNEEDHLRFISMDNNGHIGCIYRRLITGIQELEEELEYQRNDKIGYVTLCPSNLGTGLTASIYIKLPNLSKNLEKLECILKKYNLRIGAKTSGLAKFCDKDIVFISNKKKVGITEFEIMSSFQKGILEVMTEEVEQL